MSVGGRIWKQMCAVHTLVCTPTQKWRPKTICRSPFSLSTEDSSDQTQVFRLRFCPLSHLVIPSASGPALRQGLTLLPRLTLSLLSVGITHVHTMPGSH